jgi:DinB family protein
MQDYINDLRSMVERSTPALLALSAAESAQRPAPGKWSPREVLGHLIDSASNNHQRFVRAQLQDELVFPGYEQDAWVKVQRYQHAPWTELVTLWRAFNLHLAWVMAAVPESVRLRVHHRHNLDEVAWPSVPAREPATLDYFMSDYVSHLEHHLRQILGHQWDSTGIRDDVI